MPFCNDFPCNLKKIIISTWWSNIYYILAWIGSKQKRKLDVGYLVVAFDTVVDLLV